MIPHKQMLRSAILIAVSILTLSILLVCSSGLAEEIPLDVIGHSNDWMENFSTVGIGQDSSVVILPDEEPPMQISSSPGEIWVTISPFTATLSGQVTHMIAGYLGGDRAGATITISGKRSSDTDFSDITTIKPDDNGLFIWAVSSGQKDVDLFRVSARSGSNAVLSNAIRFTARSEDPIIRPVFAPVSTLIQTPVPTVTRSSSLPALTILTISARTTTPAVGEMLTISGRLTDQDGKGVGGATVTIDETGYPGAKQAEPFATTRTGSDGRFEFSLGVSFADTVGLVANYEGDENHHPSESNTLIFTAYQP